MRKAQTAKSSKQQFAAAEGTQKGHIRTYRKCAYTSILFPIPRQ